MMSSTPRQISENEKIVSRAFSEVLGEGNVDVIEELYAEEFAHHGGIGGDLSGTDEFRGWIEQIHVGFPDLEVTEEFSFSDGDLVASRVTYAGTHEGEFVGIPATGEHVEVTGTTINRVRDGKIVESWPETDALGILRQVGAVDAPGN